MTRFSHEDNGQEMECEQCGLLAPLSFTPCCGMLVCDNCRQTHTDDDCKIIEEKGLGIVLYVVTVNEFSKRQGAENDTE